MQLAGLQTVFSCGNSFEAFVFIFTKQTWHGSLLTLLAFFLVVLVIGKVGCYHFSLFLQFVPDLVESKSRLRVNLVLQDGPLNDVDDVRWIRPRLLDTACGPTLCV